MSKAQAHYLRIYSGAITYYRWQSYYVSVDVTWESQQWSYQGFEPSGIATGSVEAESAVTIDIPATTIAINAVLDALSKAQLIELRIYEFDTRAGNYTPQANQTLISTYIGEVTNVTGTLTSLQIELGSSLSPIGAQIPPRKFTTTLIGAPCRL